MKKGLTALVLLFISLSITIHAEDRGRVITFEKLPQTAIQFINQYFSKDQVLLISEESEIFEKEYKVLLSNNASLKFDRNGEWTEVECKLNAVPNDLIPSKISTWIDQKFPGIAVSEIQREKRGWEVRLMNGISLEFDKYFNLVDYDD